MTFEPTTNLRSEPDAGKAELAAASPPRSLLGEIRETFEKHPLPKPWQTLLACALLFVVFWPLYLHIGLAMESQDTLRNNMFFHSDIGRVINDMAKWDAPHSRTSVHPLFVMLTQPIGRGLSFLVESPIKAALLLNSAAGGLSVAFTCLFLRVCGTSLRRATLGALWLGFSASNLYFGSAPETFIFSALSVIVLFFCVVKRPGRWSFFLPAGIASFGILITNLAMVVIAYGVSLLPPLQWAVIRKMAALGVSVILAAAALALIQQRIWPTSNLFFHPQALEGESRFQSDHRSLHALKKREFALLSYVFFFDFVAPKTYINRDVPTRPALQIAAKYARPGRVAAALLGALLLSALWQSIRARLYQRPVILGLALCIAFNFLLHTLYGDDLFLYSSNTCFTVVAWTILCLSTLQKSRSIVFADCLLFAFVFMEAVNNYPFAKALVLMRNLGSE